MEILEISNVYREQRHKSWLAPCMPRLRRLGDSGCALASTGAPQVANWFVRVIILGGLSGDLQLITLVVLIALARTYGVALRRLLMEGVSSCFALHEGR